MPVPGQSVGVIVIARGDLRLEITISLRPSGGAWYGNAAGQQKNIREAADSQGGQETRATRSRMYEKRLKAAQLAAVTSLAPACFYYVSGRRRTALEKARGICRHGNGDVS